MVIRTGVLSAVVGLGLALTGPVASAADNAAADTDGGKPIGPTSWPTWRGRGDGVTTDTGLKLVDDPKAVRKVWTSEIRDMPYGWAGSGGTKCVKLTGGYGSPLVVAGKVFIAWWEPSGEVVDETCYKAAKARDPRRERWLVRADEIMACLDARTGKTLWKTRMEGNGWNHQYHNHCALYYPAVADGVVCFNGNGGWLYCLSVEDGALRWKARLGPVTDLVETFKKKGEIHWRQRGWNKHTFNVSPAIVDGVVASNDLSGDLRGANHGMVGFDLKTGEQRWRVPECFSRITASPMIWRHGGKSHLIAAGPKRAVCVELKTGEVAWQIDPPEGEVEPLGEGEKPHPRENAFGDPVLVSPHTGCAAVAGEVLVLPPNHGWSREGFAVPWQAGQSAWKLSPRGPELMWRQSRRQFHSSHSATAIYRGMALLHSFKGIGCALVDLKTGRVHGKVGGFGRGEVQASVGDGWAFLGPHRVRLNPENFVKERLPVAYEPYTSTFYADGFLFTRGPVEGVTFERGQPRPNCNAVHCYDLRKP